MTARLIMKMRVIDAHEEPGSIRVLTLAHPTRPLLPEPSPGAHVDLRLPDGKVRQYSLCGDPWDRSRYRIAVKRETEGRGGSKWICDNLVQGAEIHVSAPRNHFPLQEKASKHLLIAGGIGITPLLAMARQLQRMRSDFELHYCSRLPRPAFADELEAICGGGLRFYSGLRLDVAALLKRYENGAHAYVCGPQRLADGVRQATAHWPEGTVHFEHFQPVLDETFEPEPFDIKIASTGEVIRVSSNESALSRLKAAGFALPSSCELGLCGACECAYRDGTVIHRDVVLPPAARRDRMMLCVSRARAQVTLEL